MNLEDYLQNMLPSQEESSNWICGNVFVIKPRTVSLNTKKLFKTVPVNVTLLSSLNV